MKAPYGMIPVEDFARRKGITTEKAIKMIREGFYSGRLVNEQWFADESESAPRTGNSVSSASGNSREHPPLTVLFFVLAGLSLLGGLVLCGQLWPGDPGYGRVWKTIVYIPSITWLTVGVVQFALFTAIGQGLSYLRQIVSNTASSGNA